MFSEKTKDGITTQKSSQKILEILSLNSACTIENIAKELGITDRAVKKNIVMLKKEGLLKRIGPDKGGYWKIKMKKTGGSYV